MRARGSAPLEHVLAAEPCLSHPCCSAVSTGGITRGDTTSDTRLFMEWLTESYCWKTSWSWAAVTPAAGCWAAPATSSATEPAARVPSSSLLYSCCTCLHQKNHFLKPKSGSM